MPLDAMTANCLMFENPIPKARPASITRAVVERGP